MNRFLPPIFVVLLYLAGTGNAYALTVIPRTFDELVERADTVFKGAVVAKTSLWVGSGETRHIATRVTWRVDEVWKGRAPEDQTLEFVGGKVGDTTLEIPGMPQFEIGQAAVLFVVGNGTQFCPLVGVTQGRFHVMVDETTGRERIYSDDRLPVARTSDLGAYDKIGVARLQTTSAAGAPAMTADDFKSEVVLKVAALAR